MAWSNWTGSAAAGAESSGQESWAGWNRSGGNAAGSSWSNSNTASAPAATGAKVPCAGGCGFAKADWHDSHCCLDCASGTGKHGKWCERIPVGDSGAGPAQSGGDSWGSWNSRWSGNCASGSSYAAQGSSDGPQDGTGGTGNSSWGTWPTSDPESWATNLNKSIDWQGIQLIKIEKDFYKEHPKVTALSEEEVEAIRKENDIEVLGGGHIPNPVTNFVEAGMPDWFLAEVQKKGFVKPTPIQVQVWPIAAQGRDLIGIAETGSGKTLAYLFPMFIHIMAQRELKAGEGPVGVVLCPTRELAMQIESVCKEFSWSSGMKSTCVYGGTKVKDQGWALQEKNDIVVAVPGRFIQLLNDGWTNLNRVTFVVLDEADEMLNHGFGQQIRLILSQIRPDRQMLMFSATWPKDVSELATEHLQQSEEGGHGPAFIRIGGDRLAACRTIAQQVLVLGHGQDKFNKLMEAIVKTRCHMKGNADKCLIFCRTKTNADDLKDRLEAQNCSVCALHGGHTQEERTWNMERFKNGDTTILVSTNLMGRGHDLPRVKFVINYDTPDNIETYVHRIGRTGRAGEKGYAMTLLAETDHQFAEPLIEVLRETKQSVPEKLTALAAGKNSWNSGDYGSSQNQWEQYQGGEVHQGVQQGDMNQGT